MQEIKLDGIERPELKIAVVVGTARPGNYTGKAARLVAAEIDGRDGYASVLVDPAELDLAPPGGAPTEDAEGLREVIRDAAGVILSTPEYHGGFSSTIKLVIENLGFPSALAGKPVALLGVANGEIGAIKSIESLRGVASHVGAIVLPGPVSVARVQSVFDADGTPLDARVEKRVRGIAAGMIDYIERHVCPAHSLEALVRAGAG
jgi:NAD(P)H-dependent FMN reductase